MAAAPPTPSSITTTTPIPAYKTLFLQSCLSANVLTFGTYTLKSGRKSPYFFNAGAFHTAPLLSAISTAYAHTIIAFLASNPSVPKPDILFGPAYKGISLASSTLLELHRLDPDTFSSVSYSHNRKEAKDHGEGGAIVGCPLRSRTVLIIDDVVTAGTAMRESARLVAAEGGKLVGFVVALDRLERVPGPGDASYASGVSLSNELTDPANSLNSPAKDQKDNDQKDRSQMSAMGQIRLELGIPTASIVTLDDLIAVLKSKAGETEGDVQRLEEYRGRYLARD